MVDIFLVILITFGIGYAAYSTVRKDQITVYFNGIEIVEGKESEYLTMQWRVAMFNSFMLVLTGVIGLVLKIDQIFFLGMPLVFQVINFGMKRVCKAKGYVK